MDDGTLHAYLDGELSPAEAQGVAAHVAQCPSCGERLEETRALIARAEQILALAAPPDRAVPPFRAGNTKPPRPVWWRVRLPVAWAATIALALGIGAYLGRGVSRSDQPDTAATTDMTRPRVPPAPVTRELARREPRIHAERAAAKPPAVAAPAPQPLLATGHAEARRDSVAREIPRESNAVGNVPEEGRYAWQKESSISIDSARRLLDADPRIVTGLPIEAIYQGRAVGYAGLVIVEQVLDRGTMIEVITGRPAPATLAGAVSTNQERAADSLAPLAPKRAVARAAAPAPAALDRTATALFVDIRGPLSADSLAALGRRLQPLRP
ncbi:MAG TPA: zf-HC2 domain-containing protein [Gemmatimonadales bacterium]|nr:zf-HC2 domain-containing protein [Gemmatimonadales bacterium]